MDDLSSEMEKVLVPAAEEALKVPLSYDEFRQACLRTYVLTALKQCHGVQNRVAIKLQTTPSTVSKAFRGKSLRGTGIPGPKTKTPAEPK